jgi:hypothetical protein
VEGKDCRGKLDVVLLNGENAALFAGKEGEMGSVSPTAISQRWPGAPCAGFRKEPTLELPANITEGFG